MAWEHSFTGDESSVISQRMEEEKHVVLSYSLTKNCNEQN